MSCAPVQTRQRRPEGLGGAGTDRGLGGDQIGSTLPDAAGTLAEVLAFADWARRRCCGFCDGLGERWSRVERAMLPCVVCRGDGRGSMLVEPGPLRDEVVLAELASEYLQLRRARRRKQVGR